MLVPEVSAEISPDNKALKQIIKYKKPGSKPGFFVMVLTISAV